MRCTQVPVLAFATLISLGIISCGGGTVLGGLPRPNTNVVAGLAAVAATAATIADPGAAGNPNEIGKVKKLDRQGGDAETIPLDLLDRMDESDADAAVPAAASIPGAP